jgi:hypothetical protein
VCKVFLGVSTGVDGHFEVGIIRKTDLEVFRFFLGRDNVRLSYVRDGRQVVQLPFLALRILQPVRRLEGSTQFGVLPESSTEHEFLESRLKQDLLEPSRLNGGLKICRVQDFLVPEKTLPCADSTCTTDWMVWYRKNWPLQNTLLDVGRVLNSMCPKHFAK